METRTFRVAFVGAGAVNFGRPQVPWDHATRLEKIGNIEFVAIVDVERNKAVDVLKKRLSSSKYGNMYKNCKVFEKLDNMLSLKPDAVFIGIPPSFRGRMKNGYDIELRCVRAGINVFVEKPMSVIPVEEFIAYAEAVKTACTENKVIMSVGYMFRYHAAILKMKELIKEHGGKVMSFNARYYFAYTEGVNAGWYDEKITGGPIVEQATHFCDLDTVQTLMLRDSDAGGAGRLSRVPVEAEKHIPVEKRIPRVTMSNWRFKDGGIGTLMHSIALPGYRYEANIDVQLDCMKLSLIEPYENSCILRVRSIKNEDPNKDQDFTFKGQDAYLTELETFIQAIRQGNQSLIQSSYADATETYKLTWEIRNKGVKG